MKKIYLLILAASFHFLNAQLTLNLSSMPGPGDIDVEHSVTNTVVALGSAGTGQTWNYNSLNVVWSSPQTTTWVAMSSVPNASLFPSGTIANWSGSGTYGVYANTSGSSIYLGDASASTASCNVYSNSATLFTFPFTFGSNVSDTYSSSVSGDNITGTVTANGHGTGTLLTPGLSTSNVLKVRQVTHQIGTLSGTVDFIQDIFYSAGNKFPLLTVFSATIASTVYTGATVNRYGFVGISENAKETDFSIAPNPASNRETHIHYSTNGDESYFVKIMNAVGQEVKEIELKDNGAGEHSAIIDLHDLNSGVYFVKLKGKNSESIKKLVIE
jgi:hypothetical protein